MPAPVSFRSRYKPDKVVVEDLSIGAEPIPIRVINNYSDEKPNIFNYATSNRFTNDASKMVAPVGDMKACSCHPRSGCLPGECECEDASSLIFDPESRIVGQPIGTSTYNDHHYVECGSHCKCNRYMSHDYLMKKVEIHYKPNMGFGVIAKQHIAAGMPIINYVGTVVTKEYHDEYRNQLASQTDYIFDNLNEEHSGIAVLTDAAHHGNISRFINHSCDPNTQIVKVYPYIYAHGSEKISLPKIVITASQNIRPGDELFVSYGSSYFHTRNIPCLCYTFCCFVPPFDFEEKAQTEKEAVEERAVRRKAVRENWHNTGDIPSIDPPVFDID
uniref:SET domain-containing protein n=1 Tax=Panagrellus redivivus TaxID=6233 RepID=A0A7E4VI45_PANRE